MAEQDKITPKADNLIQQMERLLAEAYQREDEMEEEETYPPRPIQSRQVISTFETWESQLTDLSMRIISQIKSPAIRLFLEQKALELSQDGTPKIKELRRKHYWLDKSVPNWSAPTSAGLNGARLKGVETDQELLALWKVINYYNQKLVFVKSWGSGTIRREGEQDALIAKGLAEPKDFEFNIEKLDDLSRALTKTKP
jgi:hypothetical protein